MEKVNIATPVWMSKNGPVSICDREQMNDEYLQNVLNYAEHKYMEWNNKANMLMIKVEKLEDQPQANKEKIRMYSKASRKAANKSVIFHGLIKDIRAEATRRGITVISLAQKNLEKFEILRNDLILQNV